MIHLQNGIIHLWNFSQRLKTQGTQRTRTHFHQIFQNSFSRLLTFPDLLPDLLVEMTILLASSELPKEPR